MLLTGFDPLDTALGKNSRKGSALDAGAEPTPPKKPRQLPPVPSTGLVSYALDEEEDEEDREEKLGGEQEQDDDDMSVGTDSEKSVNHDIRPAEFSIIRSAEEEDGSSPQDPAGSAEFPFAPLARAPTDPHTQHLPRQPIHVLSQEHLSAAAAVAAASEASPPENVDSESLPHAQMDSNSPSKPTEDVSLPVEPPGLCSMALQEKVDREVRRMRLDISYDPNRAIQDNKSFRNPRYVDVVAVLNQFYRLLSFSIYEKLISFLNIDEKGTNFASVSQQRNQLILFMIYT